MNDVVRKQLAPQPAKQAEVKVTAPASAPVIYTSSEIKSGLWRDETCFKNDQPCKAGPILMRLFVLNGDADKALAVAETVVASSKDILDSSKFVLIASKPVMNSDGTTQEMALRIRHTITGAELKARALAIVNLAKTEKEPTVLFKSEKARQHSGLGKNLAAGLIG